MLKNDKNQMNFVSIFASLNENDNEMYFEEQKIENENEDKAFVDFVNEESICKSCELSFASKNLLHVYIRKIKCSKKSNKALTNSNYSNLRLQNIIKIIIFKTFTKDQNFELKFKN